MSVHRDELSSPRRVARGRRRLGAKPTESGRLEHAEPGAPGPRPGLFSVGSLSGIHVLLIDDDPASREELTAILRYCGSLLTVAESDAEAIRVLGIARPDVIVVAVARRHRGEIPFVQLVRGHAAYEAGSIPIIAIVWPDDAVNVAGAIVLELRRPLDAWEVCRALSTAVTVE